MNIKIENPIIYWLPQVLFAALFILLIIIMKVVAFNMLFHVGEQSYFEANEFSLVLTFIAALFIMLIILRSVGMTIKQYRLEGTTKKEIRASMEEIFSFINWGLVLSILFFFCMNELMLHLFTMYEI